MGKSARHKILAEKAPASKLTKAPAAKRPTIKKLGVKNLAAKKLAAKSLRGGSVQYAALPWRRAAGGEIEVLLITSRETRRWVILKGWPIKGAKKPMSAAREAYEEAGVEGLADRAMLGAYAYNKRLGEQSRAMRVEVYPLRVEREHDQWPEMAEREKLWTTPVIAAGLVAEPGLRAILALFAPD
jgi:8-oxo-dGTP pyrophosphatase MutT (NUDIX family)